MFFAIWFGLALARSPAPQAPLIVELCGVTFETIIDMLKSVILFTPLGVGSLVAGSIGSAEDLLDVVTNLGSLLGVALLAQLFHVICFYGGAYWALTRKNPVGLSLSLSLSLARARARLHDGCSLRLVTRDLCDLQLVPLRGSSSTSAGCRACG